MEEAWERAVEAALEGKVESSSSSPRILTLDGAVKCLHGRLPPPALFEKFQNLENLSIANIGVSSLERFPRLRNLQRLILSDNRIAGGLEFLVEAGLYSLRDLDLSNNRIQFLEDLAPLAHLRLVSLDLYECPVTRIKDYRSKVFGMIRSLKYLDKMDSDENERPESDEEEEDDDDEDDDEIDGDDPGSGEIDVEERGRKAINGAGRNGDEVGVVDVDEDEESDADEEEIDTGFRREANGTRHHQSNGFHLAAVREEVDDDGDEEDVADDDEYDEDGDDDEMGEEIDADHGEDEDVVEVHDVGVANEDEDGVQEQEDDDDVVDEDDDDDDEVEDEEEEGEPASTGRMMSAEGEIDGHEHGEEDENETGEIGEADEQGVADERDSEDAGDEVISSY